MNILLKLSPFLYFLSILFSTASASEIENNLQEKWVGWVSQTLQFAKEKVGEPVVICNDTKSLVADFPLENNSQKTIEQVENYLGYQKSGKSFEGEFRSMTKGIHSKHIDDLNSANFKKMDIWKVEDINNKDSIVLNLQGVEKSNIKKIHVRVKNTEASKIAGKWLPWTESDEIRDMVVYIGKGHAKVPDGIWAVKSEYMTWVRDSRGRTPRTKNIMTAHPAIFRRSSEFLKK